MSPGRRRPLLPLLLALLVAPLAPPGARPAAAAGAAGLRVLLLEAGGPQQVRGGSLPPHGARVEARGGVVTVDGRARGLRWRLPADGGGAPFDVGALRVRGALEFEAGPRGLRVVNAVPLEDYVAGTLGLEVYPDWEPEMLKAQAVVVRTYALHQRRRAAGRGFDLERGTVHQAYGGYDAETPALRAAARATMGEYLRHGGAPILAAYHSASGGRTASAEEVWGRRVAYLVSLPVPNEEDSPDTYWRAPVTRTTLGRALAGLGVDVGSVRELRVTERTASGRAARVRVSGADGSEEVEAGALRRALGAVVIRSTLFEIRAASEGFVFAGSGHGHGVGMSQWGAQAMAAGGAGYREILAAFYPGAELVRGAAEALR